MAESNAREIIEIQTLLDRLATNETRLGESISAITQSHRTLEDRVRVLEASEYSRAIATAREDERDKVLYDRLDRIGKKVDALDGIEGKVSEVKKDVASVGKDVDTIKGNFSKASWTVISAIILAVVAFIIKGGLA